jgi:hypothetical protein
MDDIFSYAFFVHGRSCPPSSDLLRGEIRQIITEAEQQYGARVAGWSLRSVFFHPKGLAQIAPLKSYPGDYSGVRELVITLPGAAATDRATRLFFLAHECVHFVCGARIHDISFLEEGLCEAFASWYVHNQLGDSFKRDYSGKNSVYEEAVSLFRELDDHCPGAIREVREHRPWLSPITAAELAQAAPGCSEAVLLGLARKFPAMN